MTVNKLSINIDKTCHSVVVGPKNKLIKK